MLRYLVTCIKTTATFAGLYEICETFKSKCEAKGENKFVEKETNMFEFHFEFPFF